MIVSYKKNGKKFIKIQYYGIIELYIVYVLILEYVISEEGYCILVNI